MLKFSSLASIAILTLTYTLFLNNSGIAQSTETRFNITIPDGHRLIKYYISEDAHSWGYLYGKIRKDSKYDYEQYEAFYLTTHKDTTLGPLTYKHENSGPNDKGMTIWATDCELYITPQGNYVILDLLDGGWSTIYNGHLMNYTFFGKPKATIQKDKIIIDNISWYPNSAIQKFEFK